MSLSLNLTHPDAFLFASVLSQMILSSSIYPLIYVSICNLILYLKGFGCSFYYYI